MALIQVSELLQFTQIDSAYGPQDLGSYFRAITSQAATLRFFMVRIRIDLLSPFFLLNKGSLN